MCFMSDNQWEKRNWEPIAFSSRCYNYDLYTAWLSLLFVTKILQFDNLLFRHAYFLRFLTFWKSNDHCSSTSAFISRYPIEKRNDRSAANIFVVQILLWYFSSAFKTAPTRYRLPVTRTDGFGNLVSSIHASACDAEWKQWIDGIEDWFSIVDNQSFSNAATCNERRPISRLTSAVARHWSTVGT